MRFTAEIKPLFRKLDTVYSDSLSPPELRKHRVLGVIAGFQALSSRRLQLASDGEAVACSADHLDGLAIRGDLKTHVVHQLKTTGISRVVAVLPSPPEKLNVHTSWSLRMFDTE